MGWRSDDRKATPLEAFFEGAIAWLRNVNGGGSQWENVDGNGGKWVQRTLITGLGGHEAQVADFSNDGDPDIFTRPYAAGPNANGGRVHLNILENLAKE